MNEINENEVQNEDVERQLLSTKNAIVINENGIKEEFVIVNIYNDDTQEIYMYDLKENQSLVFEDVPTALSMYKPKFKNGAWIETATEEEIESMKPEPLPPAPPSEAELMVAEMTMAMAKMQLENQRTIAELTMAMAAMQSV